MVRERGLRPRLQRRIKMRIEQYIEHVKTLDEKYHWIVKDYEKRLPEREQIHKKFPHVITYRGHYGEGSLLDDMTNWCRQYYGNSDGKCHWRKCNLSFDVWHKNTGLEDKLEALLNNCADDEGDNIIDNHFKMIEDRPDFPKEHCHIGVWTSFFVVKTGYDYGYEDYCFKNKEDALHFKLIWDEEAERRK